MNRQIPLWRLVGLFCILVVVGVVLDQAAKTIVVATMVPEQSIAVIPGVLWFRYVLNAGAAFSLGFETTWIFTPIALVVTAVILWYLRKVPNRRWATALGILQAGAFGNLFDRLFRPPAFGLGHVVDFISLPWIVPAVFNLADLFIVTGLAMLVILNLLGDNRKKKQANGDGAKDLDESAQGDGRTEG